MSVDLSPYIGDIGRRLLGSPNPEHSTREQLRFGTNGSIAVEIGGSKAGTWYDHEHKLGGNAWNLIAIKGGMLPAAAREWLKAELGIELKEPKLKPRQQIVAEYDYTDESGALLYQSLRYGPRKTFFQRAPDGNGGWKVNPETGKWTILGVRLVPYRLPELVAAAPESTAYIVEGEKDVDNLRARGCIATCNPMGAGKWPADFAEHFHGRNVVVLPDNDETGRDHALDVAANLAPVAGCVRVIELPRLPEKGDVSDWLAAGGTREQLEALAGAAPVFDPKTVKPRTSKPESDRTWDIRIFPGAPLEVARIFLKHCFTNDGHRTLYHYRQSFYEWTGRAYPEAETENIRARLYEFLDRRCYQVDQDGKRRPINPCAKMVNSILDALRAAAHLPTSVSAPAWLDGATDDQRKLDPKDIVACSNGLLHLPTMTLVPHTPVFFGHNALEFPFDPDAPAPLEWHELLGKLWPGYFDTIDTLHEIFGYCLTGDTSQQKILFSDWPAEIR